MTEHTTQSLISEHAASKRGDTAGGRECFGAFSAATTQHAAGAIRSGRDQPTGETATGPSYMNKITRGDGLGARCRAALHRAAKQPSPSASVIRRAQINLPCREHQRRFWACGRWLVAVRLFSCVAPTPLSLTDPKKSGRSHRHGTGAISSARFPAPAGRVRRWICCPSHASLLLQQLRSTAAPSAKPPE